MNRTYLLLLLFCICSLALSAQPTGNYRSGFKKEGNRFFFTNTNSKVIIEFCTPSMFRVRSSWNEIFADNEPWMVVQYQFQPVTVTATQTNTWFKLVTSQLTIKVNKAPFAIEVYNEKGELVSADSKGSWKQADTIGCEKKLRADEHFFGFGERMDFLDRRQKKLTLNVGRGKGMPHIIGAYNILEANYSPIPFFMSTKGYGIFFHNAFPTTWDMGATNDNTYRFSAAGGELDYYFMYGPSFPGMLAQYTSLTGRSPLLPQFALGLHLGTYSGGTWGYEQNTSDRYVIELARKLRQMGIPVDLLWLDSTWRIFGKNGGKGATSFEWRETFNNPAALFDSLYAMHFNMVGLHLRPRFDNGNSIRLLDTAQKLKYTYPEGNYAGEFVNFFDSNAVNWWWQHGVMRVATIGARFLKTDEGSAFGGLANESDKTGPQGKEIPALHNLFPIAYAKAPYEKFQQYNQTRGLNQTREGYAGIQRYPFIFAGDWPSEWQYFQPVITAGLNIGVSGVGYWTHCMGGFEHNADPELYIRWVQFGMMSPLAMVFGMDHPGYKEPWNYGEDALRNFKKYDSLRYALLPYLYSYAYELYKTGMPLMRALVLHYQNDANVYNITDQYMLGDALMVCPVTTKGAQTRTVYLPAGNWVNYWTGESYTGHQYIHIVTPLDTLPMFVKAGSIIPMQPVVNYVGEKPAGVITLDVYPGAEAHAELYEDDGKSLAYQQGVYAISNLHGVPASKGYRIEIQKPAGTFMPAQHNYLLKVHLSGAPAAIQENGKTVAAATTEHALHNATGWYYDASHKLLWIQTAGDNRNNIVIDIQ
jgi:alpha-glucosidase (family GH31 glycosyl hydrolase)